jgi:hypothetical protein|tara:strand:+ start:2918 stop:3187 length:270 start_codon:yes stop_codon:yes gene_type:complete
MLSPGRGEDMTDETKLLDVVVVVTDVPEHKLHRGEIGAVVECHGNDTFEVEFVSQDGRTYALLTLAGDLLIPLRVKPTHDATDVVPAMT